MKEKLAKIVSCVIVTIAVIAVIGLCIAVRIYGVNAKFHILQGTASFGEWAFVTAPIWGTMLLMALGLVITVVKSRS